LASSPAEIDGMEALLTELRGLAMRHATGRRTETAVPRVLIGVWPKTTTRTLSLYEPMLCVVLQGAKRVMIGDHTLRYDPASYFIASLDVPVIGQVIEARPERPYLALSLRIDPDNLASLLPEVAPGPEPCAAGFAVSPVTPALLELWLRFLRLLDAPRDIAVLAPLIERELLYRLLQGPQGGVLRQIARGDSRLSQVRRAVAWIRANFDKPLRIETVADIAGMSAASFHRHFKAATAMSPLQYQKRLRLQQARTLLVADADASRAAYAVGYESASQFSREYARLFGVPPARDAARLRTFEIRADEAAA
jgi:AraC-like DNA-binding protein